MQTRDPQAWLVLAVGDDRQHGGNDGYDDEPAVHYSWDSTVPNHAAISDGDAIAIWDKRSLLGVSVIEEIDRGEATKRLYRCPRCSLAGIKARRTRAPRFKCYKCKAEFEDPATATERVDTYRSRHEVGWVDLAGSLSGPELRALCVHPQSQLSLRQLQWPDFRAALAQSRQSERLNVVEFRVQRLAGGHAQRSVRVRIGQATFRRSLLARFGPVCAFTGAAPPAALEAGHLYSYAAVGEHEEYGGLLLRRDVHRLFDLGHLAVDPATWTVDVGPSLLKYSAYASLAGVALNVQLEAAHERWLTDHWRQHRLMAGSNGASPSGSRSQSYEATAR